MVIQALKSFYSLRKSKKVLRRLDRLYRRRAKVLDPHAKEKILAHLERLQTAIIQKNGAHALHAAEQLRDVSQKLMPRSFFERACSHVFGIGFALLFAIVIRQMWFELYTIPTGSMRPTLKESDFLAVSKTDFGLNVPLTTSHFMFDPTLVQRGSVVVWTSENMDMPDSDMVYFYLFPGKKQMVKRLIGKPGDTLYFYGGKIYGIDREGRDIADLRDAKWFETLEHIPFIHFDGKVETSSLQGQGVFTSAVFQQMNMPIAKLTASPFGFVSGAMLGQGGKDPLAHYSDLWGIKNYAMARLLNESELEQIHPGLGLEKGVLYLELTHHPSLKGGKMIRDEMNRVRPDLGTSVSFIPLQQEHLDAIADHMTTCRFTVENGMAYRLGFDKNDPFYARYFPRFEGVPDGTYEMQDGKAYRVYTLGITKELPKDHPLYRKDAAHIQQLYNLGIEFLTQYSPAKNNRAQPSRYAYFRDGSLYLLKAPILHKGDPALAAFSKRELQKKLISTSAQPYFPFEDSGAPLTQEGKIDAEFIRKYGVVVPEKMYLMLGDNHAMSADSRQFGFVPQDNLKGRVSFLFSPPGERWGSLSQPEKNHFAFPNLFVWGVASLITVGYVVYRRKRKASLLATLS